MVVEKFCDINLSDFIEKKVTLPNVPAKFLDVIFSERETTDDSHGQAECQLPFARTKVTPVPIKDAKILVEGDEIKKVIELTFDVKDIEIDLIPGDTIGILTQNTEDDVSLALTSIQQGSNSHKSCNILLTANNTKKTSKIPLYVPQNLSLYKILKDCLNLRSIPKKLFLRALSEYTTQHEEKKFLEYVSSTEGTSVYTSIILGKGIPFIDILRLCPSCQPPVSLLLEHLPRLLPRPYSVANSQLSEKGELKIIFSILSDSPGLTTSLLGGLTEKFISDPRQRLNVNIYFREHTQFKYTEDEFSKNIIMIGIGCAVSPFIGFMQHKLELSKNISTGKQSISWLFTGFRYPEASIYREQIQEFVDMGMLTRHFESFSRIDNAEYKYVQDHIKANAKEFVELLLEDDTILYVCADGADISKSIQAVIRDCLLEVIGGKSKEIDAMILGFKKSSKWREDIWV